MGIRIRFPFPLRVSERNPPEKEEATATSYINHFFHFPVLQCSVKTTKEEMFFSFFKYKCSLCCCHVIPVVVIFPLKYSQGEQSENGIGMEGIGNEELWDYEFG